MVGLFQREISFAMFIVLDILLVGQLQKFTFISPELSTNDDKLVLACIS